MKLELIISNFKASVIGTTVINFSFSCAIICNYEKSKLQIACLFAYQDIKESNLNLI